METKNKGKEMFSGVVIKGAGRGKELGFPTANIPAPLDFSDGVYVARVFFDWSEFPALCFIGVAKMFGEKDRRAEIYILDWEGDLYDKEIRVELLKKIREGKKFDSAEELVGAMKEDLRLAKIFF